MLISVFKLSKGHISNILFPHRWYWNLVKAIRKSEFEDSRSSSIQDLVCWIGLFLKILLQIASMHHLLSLLSQIVFWGLIKVFLQCFSLFSLRLLSMSGNDSPKTTFYTGNRSTTRTTEGLSGISLSEQNSFSSFIQRR